jgi:hypothetical protein
LTEEESAKFWPLYNEYRAEAGKLSDRAVSLIKDYAANYENMTDDKARDLLKQQLQLEEDRMKLRKSYAGKFEKVMPAKKWRATTRSRTSWISRSSTRRRPRSPWSSSETLQQTTLLRALTGPAGGVHSTQSVADSSRLVAYGRPIVESS